MIFADDIVLDSTRREEFEKKVRQGAAYQQKENTTGSMYIGDLDGNSDINLHIDNFERVTAF